MTSEFTALNENLTIVQRVKDKARHTVSHFSEDATEATMFMKMLGIHPDQDAEPNPLDPPITPSVRRDEKK